MAFNDYLAVLDSDLYEYSGTTKSILARIAHLIIAPPEEGPNGKPLHESHPDEGFCIATQEYLACQLGVSESTVSDAVQTFVKDGWFNITKSRDRYGHDRYKYAWADGALEKIKARKRHRDEHGEYVREKQVRKQRAIPSGQFARRESKDSLGNAQANPSGNLRGGHQADCEVAATQDATQPARKLPAVVGVAVGLKSRCDERVTKNKSIAHHASLNKSKPTSTPTPKTLQTYDDNERASAPVNPNPSGRCPEPRRRGFSPPDPSADYSPAGEAPSPASPQSANRLPDADYFHNYMRDHDWDESDEGITFCTRCSLELDQVRFGNLPCESADEGEIPQESPSMDD